MEPISELLVTTKSIVGSHMACSCERVDKRAVCVLNCNIESIHHPTINASQLGRILCALW